MAPTCEVIVPPSDNACGKRATYVLTFSDGDRAPACQACAVYLEQLASSIGCSVRAQRLNGRSLVG
jgi:hypothetical protein